MTLSRIVFRSTRAEKAAGPRAGTFAPELLLMLVLVFVPILAIHAVAWTLEPPTTAAGSAKAGGALKYSGG